jgi:hypothetical protein
MVGLPTCPICLDPCFFDSAELCQNHHLIHRDCARQMLAFMPLQCPLCRSRIMCRACCAPKRRIWCECSSDVWDTMKGIYTTHSFLAVAIFSLPAKDALLGLAMLLANAVIMMRRIINVQREAEDVKGWNTISRWGLRLTHIGMDVLCFMLGATIAMLLFVYVREGLEAEVL